MIRSAMLAALIVCISHALMSVDGSAEYAPVPSVAAVELLPLPSEAPPAPTPDSDELWSAIRTLENKQAELQNRVAVLESARKTQITTPPVQITRPAPVIKPQAPVVSGNYSPRWHNYDGRTARQHAIEVHGFDPGLSDAQLARQHDAYHDRYGGDPPTAARSRPAVVAPQVSNCPGGVCPMPRTTATQSRGGVFGFGVFRRR